MVDKRRESAEIKKQRLREEAYRQYEYCREGIEKYDEHLFRIRQWNIGLTAVVLAAILGLSQTGPDSSFQPTLALFVFTGINFAFWSLDALNKSLQTVHIHNSRDTERFLRGTDPIFIGPTISLRFQRKEKRHWVGTVKNLTDETVIWFHAVPLAIFWAAILYKFSDKLCFIETNCTVFPVGRGLAVAMLVLLIFQLSVSIIWKRRRRGESWFWPVSKFFLRPRAAARYKAFCDIYGMLEQADRADQSARPCQCSDFQLLCNCKRIYPQKLLSPFRADFYNEQNDSLLFIDRCKIFRDPYYLKERQKCLKQLGFNAIHIEWTNKPNDKKTKSRMMAWWPLKPWRPDESLYAAKIESFLNAEKTTAIEQ